MTVVVSPFASLVPAPWANGGGVTTTLAAGSLEDFRTGRVFPGGAGAPGPGAGGSGPGAGASGSGVAGAAGAVPAFADSDWRVSIAELNGPSTFSAFPGFDRTFTVIEEGIVELSIRDAHGKRSTTHRLARFDQSRFAGESTVDCVPPAGRTRDLNLFTRRGICFGDVRIMSASDGTQPSPHPRLIVVLDVEPLVSPAVRSLGDALWIPAGVSAPLSGARTIAIIDILATA